MDEFVSKIEENKRKPKKIIDRPKRKSFGSDERSVTDKSWCILFLVVFIIWIVACYYAITHNHNGDIKIEADNSTETKNISQTIPYYLWGENWLFDAITCNVAFLDTHYENSGSIVIFTNVLFCIFLIVYSLSLISRTDEMFHGQLGVSCLLFAIITLYCRLMFFSNDKFLPIPELLLIAIWCIKKFYVDEQLNKHFRDEMLSFRRFGLALHPIILTLLCIFFTCRIIIKYGLSEWFWNRSLICLIIVGGIYLSLTIFYFFLMVVSCDISMDTGMENVWRRIFKDLPRSFLMVGRFHFGTASYHATLILPRLQALKVMNEPEFKSMPKYTKITDRFYAMHCELHSLTLMSTAVGGIDHSKSLRELLRHFASDLPPKLTYFQGFSQISRSSISLLLSTNVLITILLWSFNLHDPQQSLASWNYYICSMIGFDMTMKICDAVMDTMLLHLHYESFSYAPVPTDDETQMENVTSPDHEIAYYFEGSVYT